MHVFVDQLVVEPDAMASDRRFRHERRIREGIVDVIKDQRRFRDDVAVVHQRRHHSVRVELHIDGIVLVPLQREKMLLGLLAFFLQRDAHLLGTNRIDVVIEFQHSYLLTLDYAVSFWQSCERGYLSIWCHGSGCRYLAAFGVLIPGVLTGFFLRSQPDRINSAAYFASRAAFRFPSPADTIEPFISMCHTCANFSGS